MIYFSKVSIILKIIRHILLWLPLILMNLLLAFLVIDGREPIRIGEPSIFFEYSCGIEVQSYKESFPYTHETGIYPVTEGWYVYFYQEHHGRHVFRVSEEKLLELMPEVLQLLPRPITRTVKKYSFPGHEIDSEYRKLAMEDDFMVRESRRLKCLQIAESVNNDPYLSLKEISRLRSQPSEIHSGHKAIANFQKRWEKAKRYWLTLLFEFVFINGWWIFSILPFIRKEYRHRFAFHIGFSPFLLALPYFLGYSPYLFTFGHPGGVVYPGIVMLFLLPFCLIKPNPIDILILRNLPHPLLWISQVPGKPLAYSSWAMIGPFTLFGFGLIVVGLSYLKNKLLSKSPK